MLELSEFLNDHYVESEGSTFRLSQGPDFLKWVYCQPGFVKDYFMTIRNEKNNKIMATFLVNPQRLSIHGKER